MILQLPCGRKVGRKKDYYYFLSGTFSSVAICTYIKYKSLMIPRMDDVTPKIRAFSFCVVCKDARVHDTVI